MPSSARHISPAQQRFIDSLANERVVPAELAPSVVSAASGMLTSVNASALIDLLVAQPRRAATVATRNAAVGELVDRPSDATRAGRMLLAGGIEASVTLPTGSHVTIKIRTRLRTRVGGYTNAPPTDQNARTNITVLGMRVGYITVDERGNWWVRYRTRNTDYMDAVRALFGYAHGDGDGAGCYGAYRIREATRCGRCHRTLTDPVSIERGIGPECFGRSTGSHHVPATSDDPQMVVTVTGTLRQPAATVGETGGEFQQALNTVTSPRYSDRRINAARDVIAEALDAYCDDEQRDMAMGVFDSLAVQQESAPEPAREPVSEPVPTADIPF